MPCTGAVLHTLNLRLSPEQLAYIVGHAEDGVVFVEDNLVGLLEPILDRFTSVRQWVVIGDGDAGSLIRWSATTSCSRPPAAATSTRRWTSGRPRRCATRAAPPAARRACCTRTARACCTRSGTLGADSLGPVLLDRAMPVVPMFHANAWGIPYAALLTGADLVMPGRFIAAEPIARLIESQRVTLAGAVPTVWWDLLRYADAHEPDLPACGCWYAAGRPYRWR